MEEGCRDNCVKSSTVKEVGVCVAERDIKRHPLHNEGRTHWIAQGYSVMRKVDRYFPSSTVSGRRWEEKNSDHTILRPAKGVNMDWAAKEYEKTESTGLRTMMRNWEMKDRIRTGQLGIRNEKTFYCSRKDETNGNRLQCICKYSGYAFDVSIRYTHRIITLPRLPTAVDKSARKTPISQFGTIFILTEQVETSGDRKDIVSKESHLLS